MRGPRKEPALPQTFSHPTEKNPSTDIYKITCAWFLACDEGLGSAAESRPIAPPPPLQHPSIVAPKKLKFYGDRVPQLVLMSNECIRKVCDRNHGISFQLCNAINILVQAY